MPAMAVLLAEFVSERRIIVPIDRMPRQMIDAVLAAEDRDFYSHKRGQPGRRVPRRMANILRYQHGQAADRASTITQQVAAHFLLNNELSVSRKSRRRCSPTA